MCTFFEIEEQLFENRERLFEIGELIFEMGELISEIEERLFENREQLFEIGQSSAIIYSIIAVDKLKIHNFCTAWGVIQGKIQMGKEVDLHAIIW